MVGNGILLIGNFLSARGGRRAVCEDLAERLALAGWRVCHASSRNGRFAKLAEMLSTAWTRRRSYQVAHIDLYSGKAFFWAEAVCLLLQAMGRPYVLTLHGGNLPQFARRWPWRVRRLLRSAAAVTAPSEYLRREFVGWVPDVQLLPNALALEAYPFRLRSRCAPRLIWVRSFHTMYNPLMAVDVVDRLRGTYPDIKLLMIGPDRGDGSLQRTQRHIAELDLGEHVHVVPGVPKSHLPQWLTQGDIFLNTTNVDNAPVSVQEAMACGLCIVSTAAGGIGDLLTNDVDALVVPCKDVDAMTAAVRRLIENPSLSQRLSAAARATVEATDWNAVIARWTALFARLTTDKARL